MKGMRNSFILAVLVFVVVSLVAAGPLLAQGRGAGPMPRAMAQPNQAALGPLVMLVRALQQASAPPLTTEQVTQLKAAISTFRSSLPRPALDTALTGAQAAYDTAILNGNSAGMTAAATTIAAEDSKLEYTRLVAAGQGEISALAILTPAQVSALQAKLGTDGLIRLVRSMFAGPAVLGGRGIGMGVRGSAAAPMIKR